MCHPGLKTYATSSRNIFSLNLNLKYIILKNYCAIRVWIICDPSLNNLRFEFEWSRNLVRKRRRSCSSGQSLPFTLPPSFKLLLFLLNAKTWWGLFSIVNCLVNKDQERRTLCEGVFVHSAVQWPLRYRVTSQIDPLLLLLLLLLPPLLLLLLLPLLLLLLLLLLHILSFLAYFSTFSSASLL